MSSSKDLFIKKAQESQAAEKAEQENIGTAINQYRQGVFSLGESIKTWLSGAPVTVSVDQRIINDSSVSSLNSGRYEINFITITNGNKKVTISPDGLFFFGAQGAVSVQVYNPGRAPSTQKYLLFMRHHSLKEAKGWVLVKGENHYGDSKELDEDSFFEMISSIA